MDTWTALLLSRQTTRELHGGAARHRLAKVAAASARTRRPSLRSMAAATEHLETLPAEIVLDLLDEPRTT